MLKGIFINALTRDAFIAELQAGNVKDTQIAFIQSSSEIWTHGKFYTIGGLNEDLVLLLIRDNGGNIDLDDFKLFLNQIEYTDLPNSITNVINNKITSDNVYNWALSGNVETISDSKLPNNIILGYYNETDGEFYSDITILGDNTRISKSVKKIYINLTDSKLYIYTGSSYIPIGGTGGNDDLSAYVTKLYALNTYLTKETFNQFLNDAPEALDTVKELADAIGENQTAIGNLPTKNFIAENYVSKTVFEDYLSEMTTICNNYESRIAALEEIIRNLWSTVPTEGDEYFYAGTEAPTTLTKCSVVNGYPEEQIFTNNESEKKYVYVLVNDTNNVDFLEVNTRNPLDKYEDEGDSTTIPGYKIFRTYNRMAAGGSVIIKIS